MFVTTPTNFTPANPLEYPKFPRHVRAEIGRRLFREKNRLRTTEPWTRSPVGRGKCRLPPHNALSERSAAAIVSDSRDTTQDCPPDPSKAVVQFPSLMKVKRVVLFREREISFRTQTRFITLSGFNYGRWTYPNDFKGKSMLISFSRTLIWLLMIPFAFFSA